MANTIKNPNSINAEEGFNNDILFEPENNPKFDNTPAEIVYQGLNNTFIVLGRDRPGNRESGYGSGQKDSGRKCGAIDIVAGRMSSLDTTTIPNSLVNSSPAADAARLYLSQKSDIDDDYRLPEGVSGKSIGVSAALLKADEVRVVGRGSIKIITGGEDSYSNGDGIYGDTGVQLIANKVGLELQPMVKGESLKQALTEIANKIVELNGILAAFMEIQKDFNSAITSHTHLSPFFASPTSPSEILMPEGKRAEMSIYLKVEQGLKNNIANLTAWQTKFLLNPTLDTYINSIYHHLN
jgi:hypothetical protein